MLKLEILLTPTFKHFKHFNEISFRSAVLLLDNRAHATLCKAVLGQWAKSSCAKNVDDLVVCMPEISMHPV